MYPDLKVILAVLLSGTLCGAVVETLHAQTTPRAYTVIELEPLDPAAILGYVRTAEAVQQAAGDGVS